MSEADWGELDEGGSTEPECGELGPELPRSDDLAIPVHWVAWVLERVGLGSGPRDASVSAARRDPDGAWVPCSSGELLEGATVGSISQRPACGGIVTTVHLWDAGGVRGAFWLDRRGLEPPFFRVLILQALLRSARE